MPPSLIEINGYFTKNTKFYHIKLNCVNFICIRFVSYFNPDININRVPESSSILGGGKKLVFEKEWVGGGVIFTIFF